MESPTFLSLKGILPSLKASSKKQACQQISDRAALICGLPQREVLDAILDREKLGSTGLGGGVAIPHAHLEKLSGICGVFARLHEPVDFDALDDQPVDLVFMLLAPKQAGAQHLRALAKVSRLFRDRQICAKLRSTENAEALFLLLQDALELDRPGGTHSAA